MREVMLSWGENKRQEYVDLDSIETTPIGVCSEDFVGAEVVKFNVTKIQKHEEFGLCSPSTIKLFKIDGVLLDNFKHPVEIIEEKI